MLKLKPLGPLKVGSLRQWPPLCLVVNQILPLGLIFYRLFNSK